jgi:tetratricopeptide (TPR) repeat protein
MASGGKRNRPAPAEVAARLRSELARAPAGLHDLGEPATVLDTALPAALAAVYRAFDGATLYHEALILSPSRDLARAPETGRWKLGEVDGDDLEIDAGGAVWRRETDTEEWLEEGSRVDRWLHGWVDAQGQLLDADGEFRDDVFEESGELTDEAAIGRERRLLDRDPAAPAPRWRLARALARSGDLGAARDQLEQVVDERPGFAWAWFDLARISERLGELAGAADEAVAAAEADPDYAYAPFFYGHAARLAGAAGDDARRAELAGRALELEPDLARSQRAGAVERLAAGDRDSARELAEVAAALAPRDLETLDLLRQLEAADN